MCTLYMEDTTLTTTHIQARWVLSAFESSVVMDRMKPKKCISLVLRKGRVNRLVKVHVQGKKITLKVGYNYMFRKVV